MNTKKEPVTPTGLIVRRKHRKRVHLILRVSEKYTGEGSFFIARDLLAKITDQGLAENEAVKNLKKGVVDQCHLLIELKPSRPHVRLAGY